jgi:hypothetical protein
MFFADSISDNIQIQQDHKKVILMKVGIKQTKLYRELKGG